MRLAFFFLLLINLAFHVWNAGYLGTSSDGRETERLNQQVFPEKIRIVANAQSTVINKQQTATIECRLIRGLATAAAASVEKTLLASEGVTVIAQPVPEAISYWVLISNIANRPAADKKVGELRQREIEDIKVLTDETYGPFVVSLGLFSTEEAAQAYLQSIAKKGVRSARIEKRTAADKATLEIRAAAELLQGLPETIANYPEASLGDCPAATAQ